MVFMLVMCIFIVNSLPRVVGCWSSNTLKRRFCFDRLRNGLRCHWTLAGKGYCRIGISCILLHVELLLLLTLIKLLLMKLHLLLHLLLLLFLHFDAAFEFFLGDHSAPAFLSHVDSVRRAMRVGSFLWLFEVAVV